MGYEMYVARDKNGRIFVYENKPRRYGNIWVNVGGSYIPIGKDMFPNLKWEDEPLKVVLTEQKEIRQSQQLIEDEIKDINIKIKLLKLEKTRETERLNRYYQELIQFECKKADEEIEKLTAEKMMLRSDMNKYVGHLDAEEEAAFLDLRKDMKIVSFKIESVRHRLSNSIRNLKIQKTRSVRESQDYLNEQIIDIEKEKIKLWQKVKH